MKSNTFHFQQFTIHQERCAMKVGTDGVLLGAWAKGGKRILDIGTGTGLIALMMAQRYPHAEVVGIDIDAEACIQARENVAQSPFQRQVHIVQTPLQEFHLPSPTHLEMAVGECFDSIVSNPPYFIHSLKNPDSKRTLARHADSLSPRDLFDGVKRLLAEDGIFSIIIPSDRMNDFLAEGYFYHLYPSRRCFVKTLPAKPPKRCLLSFCKQHPTTMEETIVNMMESPTVRSEWYKKLTEDYYL